MTLALRLTPLDPTYPSRLRTLKKPPASISIRGGPVEAARTVAIIGSRAATEAAAGFAGELAGALVRAGAVVVSGGAAGIDAAAHQGALAAGGRTWMIAGTGPDGCYPPEHKALFARIAQGPGAMLWPFEAGARFAFLARNRVLAALADAVVVVQAGLPSGALNGAAWARKLAKPLWVVPAAPWMDRFEGSRKLLDEGARPLTSIDLLMRSLAPAVDAADALLLKEAAATAPRVRASGAQEAPRPGETASPANALLSPEESTVLAAITNERLHIDDIASRAHLSIHVTAAALLTLALENVVVEGPESFFRRRDAHNR